MQGEIGQQLLASVDFTALQARLMEVMIKMIGVDNHSFEQKSIVANALSIWMHC
jgi:hypothetical protein